MKSRDQKTEEWIIATVFAIVLAWVIVTYGDEFLRVVTKIVTDLERVWGYGPEDKH